MIKIIRRGTRKTIECDECGCLFSYESEDIQTEERPDFGKPYYQKIILCPQCNKEIYLEATK